MATLGTESVDVVLPSGVSSSDVAVTTGADGSSDVVLSKPVNGLEIKASSGTTDISGSELKKSTITGSTTEGTAVTVTVNDTVAKKLTVDFSASKKAADSISFGGTTTVKKGTIDLGKGNDTITFKSEVKFKGTTTIDLGKGGKDVIVIEANKIKKGTLEITNFGKKDKLTIGDDTYKKGDDMPSYIELA